MYVQWEAYLDSYMQEAKWIASSYMPTFEEYYENGKLTSAHRISALQPILMLDIPFPDHILKEVDYPSKLNDLGCAILRLRGDTRCYKVSDENGRSFALHCAIDYSRIDDIDIGVVIAGGQGPWRRSFLYILLYERQSWINRGRCSQSYQRNDQ